MKATLSFKIDEDLKKILEDLADKNRRPLSNFVVMWLEDIVNKHYKKNYTRPEPAARRKNRKKSQMGEK